MSKKLDTQAKVRFDGKWTAVPNELINDQNLSARAKGVYAYLHSKPEGWSFYMREIVKNFKEPYGAIKTAIMELEGLGYVERKRVRKQSGIFEYEWHIHNSPPPTYSTPEQTVDGLTDSGQGGGHSNTDCNNTEVSNTDKSSVPPYPPSEVVSDNTFGNDSSNKQSSTQTETSHETQLRVRVHKIFIISKEPPIFPRDGSEERAWQKLRPFIREEDVQTLEDFYRLPKSEEYDRTWQRRKDARHLMYHWQEQLELAREHFVYQRKKFLGEENKMDPEEHYNRYVSNF